jgi:hypothetical protein
MLEVEVMKVIFSLHNDESITMHRQNITPSKAL